MVDEASCYRDRNWRERAQCFSAGAALAKRTKEVVGQWLGFASFLHLLFPESRKKDCILSQSRRGAIYKLHVWSREPLRKVTVPSRRRAPILASLDVLLLRRSFPWHWTEKKICLPRELLALAVARCSLGVRGKSRGKAVRLIGSQDCVQLRQHPIGTRIGTRAVDQREPGIVRGFV